eukprot:4576440-Alexandrium_andersonii.AAC.1
MRTCTVRVACQSLVLRVAAGPASQTQEAAGTGAVATSPAPLTVRTPPCATLANRCSPRARVTSSGPDAKS